MSGALASIVDFTENAFGSSLDEIAKAVRHRPDELLRRKETVLGLLEDAWLPQPLFQSREVEKPGEVWPVLPRSAPDPLDAVNLRLIHSSTYGTSARSANASQRDIQSLLLYAHGVHLPNPYRYVDDNESSAFLRAVAQICVLGPLIQGGVVRIFDPGDGVQDKLSNDQRDAVEALAAHIGLALMSYESARLNQGSLKMAADILVARAFDHMDQLAASSDLRPGSLLLPTAYDGPAMNAVVAILNNLGLEYSEVQPSKHQLRLSQLVRMQLPGLANLDLRDMVHVRDDSSFGVFRTSMAAALADVETDVSEGRIEAARRTVGEHMDAGLAQLRVDTKKGVLGDATIGDAIGWGLGAAVAGSIAGWLGALSALVGGAGTELVRKSPSKAQQALRSHYVELGTASLRVVDEPSIDFLQFSTDALWGPALGETRRVSGRRRIVGDLLDEDESADQ